MNKIILTAIEKVKGFYQKYPKLAIFLFGVVTGLFLAFIF
jgi:hypothetical protein